MASTTEPALAAGAVPHRPVTLGWALKRAVIGIAIITVAMGSVAWLTYASTDPDIDPPVTKSAKVPRAAPTAVRL